MCDRVTCDLVAEMPPAVHQRVVRVLRQDLSQHQNIKLIVQDFFSANQV